MDDVYGAPLYEKLALRVLGGALLSRLLLMLPRMLSELPPIFVEALLSLSGYFF